MIVRVSIALARGLGLAWVFQLFTHGVVLLLFFLITDDRVCIVDLFELVLVEPTCLVGVILVAELVVRILYLFGLRFLRQTQHFVVVDFWIEVRRWFASATTPEATLWLAG